MDGIGAGMQGSYGQAGSAKEVSQFPGQHHVIFDDENVTVGFLTNPLVAMVQVSHVPTYAAGIGGVTAK